MDNYLRGTVSAIFKLFFANMDYLKKPNKL